MDSTSATDSLQTLTCSLPPYSITRVLTGLPSFIATMLRYKQVHSRQLQSLVFTQPLPITQWVRSVPGVPLTVSCIIPNTEPCLLFTCPLSRATSAQELPAVDVRNDPWGRIKHVPVAFLWTSEPAAESHLTSQWIISPKIQSSTCPGKR